MLEVYLLGVTLKGTRGVYIFFPSDMSTEEKAGDEFRARMCIITTYIMLQMYACECACHCSRVPTLAFSDMLIYCNV